MCLLQHITLHGLCLPLHSSALQCNPDVHLYDSKGSIPSYAPFQIRISLCSYVVLVFVQRHLSASECTAHPNYPHPTQVPFIRKLFPLSHLMLHQGLQRQKHRVIIPHTVSPAFDVLFRTGGRAGLHTYLSKASNASSVSSS